MSSLRGRRWRQQLALRRLPAHEGALIRRVQQERLTYLSTGKLVRLARLADRIRADAVPGDFVECGCALGGSAIVLAGCMGARGLRVYDVFGMIPPPSDVDGDDVRTRYAEIRAGSSAGLGGDTYYGYITDLETVVRANFARLGYPVDDSTIALIPGLLEDTLVLHSPVALAHVDVDWYDPVRVSIERLWPHLAVGGVLVFDDYFTYSGCTRAVDDFLGAIADQVAVDDAWESRAVTRVR